MTDTPGADDFARQFSAAFAADGGAIGRLLDDEAQVLTLSGQYLTGRDEAARAFAAEFAGLFATARLVTGKATLRWLGPGAAVLHQRFVVTGAQSAPGAEMPRFAAVLSAVHDDTDTASLEDVSVVLTDIEASLAWLTLTAYAPAGTRTGPIAGELREVTLAALQREGHLPG